MEQIAVARLIAPGRMSLTYETVMLRPAEGEAVVRVRVVGICGTDVHIFHGQRSDVSLPRILGHELSGEVMAIGSGVEGIRPGDRVVLDPVIACGHCKACRGGYGNVCAEVKCYGVQMDGGLRDLIVVPAKRLSVFTFGAGAEAAPEKIIAGVFIRSLTNPYEVELVEGAKMFADFFNNEGYNIEVQVFPCDSSDEKQISDLKAFVINEEEGVEKIVFMITNTDPLMAEVAEVCEDAEVYWAYAIGSNEKNLQATGVNVGRVKVMVFLMSGFGLALAGIIAALRLGRGELAMSSGKMFPAFTAIVLGGTPMSGGRGGMVNTLFGALIVTVLINGMVLMGVSAYVQDGIQGIVILVAVILSIKRGNRVVNK